MSKEYKKGANAYVVTRIKDEEAESNTEYCKKAIRVDSSGPKYVTVTIDGSKVQFPVTGKPVLIANHDERVYLVPAGDKADELCRRLNEENE